MTKQLSWKSGNKVKVLYSVLVKTLVVQFYRNNTGFFFVLLALAVGVLRSVEHYYIIMAVLHSYFLLGGLAILWSLYLIKTIGFTLQTFKESQNQFLYQMYLYPFASKVLGFLLVYVLQFLPILFYIGVIISLGIVNYRLLSSGICLLYIILSALVTGFIYLRELQAPGRNGGWYKLMIVIHHTFKKPSFTLFLFEIIHHHKISFLLTKATTFLIIILAAKLYAIGNFDRRFVHFTLAMVGLANVVLVYYAHYFENKKLFLQRNLPWSLPKRFSMHTTTLLLILLPEIAVYIRYFFVYFNLTDIVQGVLLILTIVGLLYSYLYIQAIAVEIYARRIFIAAIVYFFIILFGLPVVYIILMNMAVAYFIFYKYYYLFEYNIPD